MTRRAENKRLRRLIKQRGYGCKGRGCLAGSFQVSGLWSAIAIGLVADVRQLNARTSRVLVSTKALLHLGSNCPPERSVLSPTHARGLRRRWQCQWPPRVNTVFRLQVTLAAPATRHNVCTCCQRTNAETRKYQCYCLNSWYTNFLYGKCYNPRRTPRFTPVRGNALIGSRGAVKSKLLVCNNLLYLSIRNSQ